MARGLGPGCPSEEYFIVAMSIMATITKYASMDRPEYVKTPSFPCGLDNYGKWDRRESVSGSVNSCRTACVGQQQFAGACRGGLSAPYFPHRWQTTYSRLWNESATLIRAVASEKRNLVRSLQTGNGQINQGQSRQKTPVSELGQDL